MKKVITALLISLLSCGLNADIIEQDYSLQTRLFAPYLNLDIPALMNGTAAQSKSPYGTAQLDNFSPLPTATNLNLASSYGQHLGQETTSELALINQLLGANAPLVKSQYLDFKNNFTEFVSLGAQQGLNQSLVFDQALVSKPKDDFRWDRARVEVQGEGTLGWSIHWIQAIYKYMMDPTKLAIILLLLSVVVLIKRRFFA